MQNAVTTIEAKAPEPVLQQARESYVAMRAKRASREAFERALAEVPDAPPLPGDEWPPLA